MRFVCLTAALVLASHAVALADSFGTGPNAFEIEFVSIGNPGNLTDTKGDPNPAGSVPYVYRIGKYEISEDLINKANTLGGLGIVHANNGANRAAESITWFEAAKFVNWLNTSTGNSPAYNFDSNGNFQLWTPSDPGYNPSNLYRNSIARYVLPADDEWYKAAFYDPLKGVYYDYPIGSNNAPNPVSSGIAASTAVWGQQPNSIPADATLAGGLSPYGTMGQGGNVWEWLETDYDHVNDSTSSTRGVRGGVFFSSYQTDLSSFVRIGSDPFFDTNTIGFRVVSIAPEPSTAALLVIGCVVAFVVRRR